MDSTIEPNVSDQTVPNQTTVIERMKKKQNTDPLGQREGFDKNKPENVV